MKLMGCVCMSTLHCIISKFGTSLIHSSQFLALSVSQSCPASSLWAGWYVDDPFPLERISSGLSELRQGLGQLWSPCLGFQWLCVCAC